MKTVEQMWEMRVAACEAGYEFGDYVPENWWQSQYPDHDSPVYELQPCMERGVNGFCGTHVLQAMLFGRVS